METLHMHKHCMCHVLHSITAASSAWIKVRGGFHAVANTFGIGIHLWDDVFHNQIWDDVRAISFRLNTSDKHRDHA